MCYYIGIEDLAANALIAILRAKGEPDDSQYRATVTLTELEKYGTAVIHYLNEEKSEKALLILSRASTTHMFRNYSDFFNEVETEEGIAISLQEGKTVEDLVAKFTTYIVRRRITIGCNSKLNSRLTPIRPRGLACNCTFLPA